MLGPLHVLYLDLTVSIGSGFKISVWQHSVFVATKQMVQTFHPQISEIVR